jgi:transcriptional regulator with XRE-family HTH domain
VNPIGTKLREIRRQRRLSLREVKARSAVLAEQWGNSTYEISGSWLARLESGKHEMTVPKLISLATIYSEPPEELLRQCHPSHSESNQGAAMLVQHRNSLDQTRNLSPDPVDTDPIPERTTLLPLRGDVISSRYRQVIVGRRDGILVPMIRPGAILKIDIRQRTIASRKGWTNEFDRPIYLLLTHAGYVCGWCELDKDKTWLTVVTHPLSVESYRRWNYRNEVEVIGRAVAVIMQLTP